MSISIKHLEDIIEQAQSIALADLVIKNVNIFHLTTGEMEQGDIAICNETIVGVGESYDGKEIIDGTGLTAVPGFIDSHLHIESTQVTPFEFERGVLAHGVTTGVCDPHELANVAGLKAFDFFFDSAERMCMDLMVQISSCVPATNFETSGATICADEMKKYLNNPKTLGLAELMNVPGVLFKDRDILEKVQLFHHHIDGHSPQLSGKQLNAYLAVGAKNCHEVTTLAEGKEKLKKGMQVLIHESAASKNLNALLPLITVENAPFLGFCSDDINSEMIMRDGHLDVIIGKAISLGADPLAVYRVASLSSATHFKLNDRGLIAAGKLADIVLLSDFEKCKISMVIKSGKVVNEQLFKARGEEPDYSAFLNSVKSEKITAEQLKIFSKTSETSVIGVEEHSLITAHLREELEVANGEKLADVNRDILKVAVVERHGKNGNIGLGFVKGFGIKSGAIASSIGHDSHNICVVGSSDAEIAMAVNALIDSQGGFAVVQNGSLLDVVALPIGGLISTESIDVHAQDLARLHNSIKSLECTLSSPIEQLAFLPLLVIPSLKISDKGLFDVDKFQLI